MRNVSARGRRLLSRERERMEAEAEESTELNLVPYLDIVTNILLFLLVTVTSTMVLGNIEVVVPQYSQSASAAQKGQDEKEALNLTVVITNKGFTVAGSDSTLGVVYENDVKGQLPTVPRKGESYEYEKLQQLLAKIKKQYPKEEQAILTANPDIQYETVIGAMDVMRIGPNRESLFPMIRFSTGIQ